MAAGVEPRRNNTVASPVRAHVLAVIDGDTLAVSARIWIGQTIETRVRLAGVDTPELRGDCDQEHELVAAARDFVTAWVGGGDVILWDVRYDNFGGRVLARVKTGAGADLGSLLIGAGFGRAYDGGKRKPWC
ncbi:MAG: thermonuclease family protein [Alphaproteobacteria bacterium]